MALKRPGEVTLIGTSAIEHVGQIGAFARFILQVRTVSRAIAMARKPAYERGQKWMRYTLLLALM